MSKSSRRLSKPESWFHQHPIWADIITILIIVGVIVLVVFFIVHFWIWPAILDGYKTGGSFTGNCSDPKINYKSGCIPYVTVYNWVQTLSAPVVSAITLILLSLVAYLLDRRSKRRDEYNAKSIRDRENEKEQERILDTYIKNHLGMPTSFRDFEIETMIVLSRINSNEKYFVMILILARKFLVKDAQNKALMSVYEFDLSYIDFSPCTEALTNLKLVRCNLRYACFDGQDLTDTDFSGSDLTGASFKGAILIGATLTGVTLKNAFLDRADLTEAHYVEADLKGASLKGTILENGASGAPRNVHP